MLLNNRYLIQDSFGRGLMATIYRGIDTLTDQIVAIKVLRETYSTDPKFVKLFQNEAKLMSVFDNRKVTGCYPKTRAPHLVFSQNVKRKVDHSIPPQYFQSMIY